MPKIFPVIKRVIQQIFAGDQDVTFEESIDFSDQLSGVLGPIIAPDSIDFGDEFVADELTLQDSVDASDQLRALEGLAVQESVDIADQLSGVLGPIQAPDSLDISDDPDVGPLVLSDSLDTDDAIQPATLSAQSEDSIDLGDHPNAISVSNFPDALDVEAELGAISPTLDESMTVADQFDTISALQVGESIGTDDAIQTAQISSVQQESIGLVAVLQAIRPTPDDSIAVAAALVPDTLDTTEYSENVVSSSNVSSPNNILGNNTNTSAFVESIGSLLAQPPSVNYSIVVDFGDLDISDVFGDFDDADAHFEWQVEVIGVPVDHSWSMDVDYSNNNGSSFSEIFTDSDSGLGAARAKQITNVDLGTALDTETEYNGSRIRFDGNVNGGTALLEAGLRLRLFRVWITTNTTE